MNRNLKTSKSIEILASPDQVWEALTNPEKIAVYLYGTETITDWKVGSPIIFQGEYEGHKYKDKGIVLENEKNKILKYSYWSGFSGLADTPENYSIVTYLVEENSNGNVIFTWKQEGYATEEGQKHSEQGLPSLLEKVKTLVEEKG